MTPFSPVVTLIQRFVILLTELMYTLNVHVAIAGVKIYTLDLQLCDYSASYSGSQQQLCRLPGSVGFQILLRLTLLFRNSHQ